MVATAQQKEKWVDPRDAADVIPLNGLSGLARQDLKYFFQRYEADIGRSSNMGACIDALRGLRGGGPNDAHDRMIQRIESGDAAIGLEVFRTLRRLDRAGDGLLVVVLGRICGPWEDPPKEFAQLGPLGFPLADLTPTVERVREDLALAEGEKQEAVVADHFSESAIAKRFWEAAVDRDAARAFILEASKKEPEKQTDEDKLALRLAKRRANDLNEEMRDIVMLSEPTARERARIGATISAMHAADVMVTTTDCLRAKMIFRGDGRDKAAKKAFVVLREAFKTGVRKEAFALRSAAEAAFMREHRGRK